MLESDLLEEVCKEQIERRDALILEKCGVRDAKELLGRLEVIQCIGEEEETWVLDGVPILRIWPPKVEREYRGERMAFCVIQDVEELV